MTLIKTSLLNSIAVGVRIFTMLALNKLLAIHVGPSGYAIIGQFQNFISMVATISSGAINTGVTKYTAEHFDDEPRQISYWKTASTIAFIGSVGFGIVIILLHQQLSVWIFHDKSLGSVLVYFGIGLVLYTLNSLLLSILNGKKEIRRYVAVNISGSLVGLLVTGFLATRWGLYGALVALAVNQSIVFGVTLLLCWQTTWFQLQNIVGKIDFDALRNLSRFALMAITSAICIPASQILIRNHLGNNFGWESAGHWEALMRISGLYLMIVTTPLAVYYLPRMSEIRSMLELRQEISFGYKLILPVVITGSLIIYFLRSWIVTTLFTPDFSPMTELFAWQMVGDVLKIGSWLLAHVMIAKALTKTFIATEVGFSISLVILAVILTDAFGITGVTVAYAASYAIYWIAMFFILRSYSTAVFSK